MEAAYLWGDGWEEQCPREGGEGLMKGGLGEASDRGAGGRKRGEMSSWVVVRS